MKLSPLAASDRVKIAFGVASNENFVKTTAAMIYQTAFPLL